MARQGKIASTRGARSFAPLRRHPLVSVGTACWFAALFGLSALAIRADQLEALVIFAGIDRVVPVVVPPLGMTARVLTALGFAVVGGLIGRVLGDMLAMPPRAAAESVGPRGEPPEPIIAVEPQPAVGVDFAPELSSPAPPPLGKAAERLLAADLTSLSPIELVERLGIVMQCPASRLPEVTESAFQNAPVRRVSTPPRRSPPAARIGNEQGLRFALANLQRVSGAA